MLPAERLWKDRENLNAEPTKAINDLNERHKYEIDRKVEAPIKKALAEAEEKAPENLPNIVVNQDTIKTEEDTRNLKLNADGTYVANEGDCFNTIAKRYLNDIYLNEPDSFANLSFAKKENKIFNETNRILSINPKYEWDSAHYQTNPELMVGDIIKVK